MKHLCAIAITALGIVVLSPDSTLVRLLDADLGTTLFWRGLALALGSSILIFARGGTSNPAGAIRSPAFWVLTGCFALANTLFAIAIKAAPIADTLGSMATTSIFAAIFSFLFLGERLSRRLLAAALGAGVGLFLITLFGGGQLLGRIIGVGAAAAFGAIFVAMRAPANRDPLPALAVSGVVLGMLSAAAIDPGEIGTRGVLAAAGIAVVLPGSMWLIGIGAERLNAAEIGLLALLETLFGTFWGWLFLGEVPIVITRVAIAIILTTLIIYYTNEFRLARTRRTA